MKYVGVIVTYNRKELLLNNLNMLSKQVEPLDKIIIIDNHSTDGSYDIVKYKFRHVPDWIDYVYMAENTGGAGGFFNGVKRAYEMGAEFIYLMDDDGFPFDIYTFKNIKEASKKLYEKNKLLFLNSLVTTDGIHLSFDLWPNVPKEKQLEVIRKISKDNVIYRKVNPFNGTLITRDLVDEIGFPRGEFFLSRDEVDYVRRSEKVGAIIATITNSIYCHPPTKLIRKKIGKYSVQIYSDLDKEYYFLRNATYTYKDCDKKKIFLFCLSRFITIILYEDQKVTRIKQIKIAVSDAFNNKMGKRER